MFHGMSVNHCESTCPRSTNSDMKYVGRKLPPGEPINTGFALIPRHSGPAVPSRRSRSMPFKAPDGYDQVEAEDGVGLEVGEVGDSEIEVNQQRKMSSREDNPGVARGRAGSGPRTGSTDSAKHQMNDSHWKEQVHTMVKSDSESELSDSEHFLTKGAFLLTPSHDLSMEKASTICEKMTFKGCFSLTKTATGILFKFSDFEDYQAVYRKGFHKVTNSRFYRKVIIPCRPQKTFTVYVFDIPDDLPEEDVRHSLYKFSSIVEVVRIQLQSSTPSSNTATSKSGARRTSLADNEERSVQPSSGTGVPSVTLVPPPTPSSPGYAVRVTLASVEECNILLQNGLDFYGATFFPTELASPQQSAKIVKPSRVIGGSISARVRDLLPVFDNSGFAKLPPPAMKMIKPRGK